MSLDEMMRDGVRGEPDVAAFASYDSGAKKLAVMVWYYHDDDLPGPDASVNLALAGLPSDLTETKLTHYRIDQDHSNAYAEWLRMGSPVAPNLDEYGRMQRTSELGQLSDAPKTLQMERGSATLKFNLPRQGVSLVMLEW